MAQVSVSVNGKSYRIACDDGQEKHVTELAQYLDHRVKELAASVGQVGEARLLLMAGLLIASDLAEADAQLEALSAERDAALSTGERAVRAASEASEGAEAALNRFAQRLEDIAAALNSA